MVIKGGQGGNVLAQFDFDMELAECLNQYWVIIDTIPSLCYNQDKRSVQ